MQNFVGDLLSNKGVAQYRLISNAIKKTEISFLNDELQLIESSKVHNLLFLWRGGICYKLITPEFTEDALEAIIDNLSEQFGTFCAEQGDISTDIIGADASTPYSYSPKPICTDNLKELASSIINRYKAYSLQLLYISHLANRIDSGFHSEQQHYEIQYRLEYTNAEGILSYKNGTVYSLDQLSNMLLSDDSASPDSAIVPATYECAVLHGIVYFPTEVMIPIYNALIMALSGELISSDFSMIKDHHFTKQFIAPCITITDNPIMDKAPVFDAEGSLLFSKILVDNGVLVQALNSMKSASSLGQTPGNCYFNYLNYTYEINCAAINIDIEESLTIEYDIMIEKYGSGVFQIDMQTGLLTCNLIGYDMQDKQLKTYLLNTSIQQLLLSVVGGIGNAVSNHNIVTRDVILDFGG